MGYLATVWIRPVRSKFLHKSPDRSGSARREGWYSRAARLGATDGPDEAAGLPGGRAAGRLGGWADLARPVAWDARSEAISGNHLMLGADHEGAADHFRLSPPGCAGLSRPAGPDRRARHGGNPGHDHVPVAGAQGPRSCRRA